MDFTNLKEMLDQMVGKYYQGVDICIHHKSKEVLRYQTGYSDLENKIPVNPNAMYYIFSCSKPITCTAAMQLFEKGRFLLNDPVSAYMPEFKDMYVKQQNSDGSIDIVKANSEITVKHLLTMTSGINYNLTSPSITKVMNEKGNEVTTADIIKAIANEPLDFHPGEMWQYGLNHDVIGRLIEVVSGMSFGEYLKKNIFDKCGMENTCFNPGDEIKAKIPPAYTTDENGNLVKDDWSCEYAFGENSKFEGGGAGLVSCVDDYIKFTDAMANCGLSPSTGERLLTEKTVNLMRTNMLDEKQSQSYWKYNDGYGYGLGVRTFIGGKNSTLLASEGEFGWDGAAGSYMIIDPKEQLSVFSARYTRPPYNYEVNLRILNVIYSILLA